MVTNVEIISKDLIEDALGHQKSISIIVINQ